MGAASRVPGRGMRATIWWTAREEPREAGMSPGWWPQKDKCFGAKQDGRWPGHLTWHQREHEGRSRSEWASRKDHRLCGMLAGGKRGRKSRR